MFILMLADSVTGKGYAGPHLSVRLFVCLFPLYVINQLTFDLDYCACMGHGHSSSETKRLRLCCSYFRLAEKTAFD